ncbi:secretory subunit [Orbilia oligospora]|uniref:Secretory subunit n=1 Tax=Orbilia oligospora TaxID=2813651 RepID=A0A8H2HQM4_ORBOL|nr:secretory subunit [Orbilia oligospora]
MSTDYNYDEQGQFFPYFVATMLFLTLAPVTYSTFAPSKQVGLQNNPRIESSFKPADYDHIEQHKRKKRKESRRIKRMIFLALGWSLFSYMIYLVVTSSALTPQIWDPYSILGISMSASEKAIKSHYRRLSIKFHPDKVKLEGNDTMEAANERWVEITKAYKALTDEEIRKNYQEYGHPDGKQSYSIGIALPQWTIADGSKYYVLAFYGVMFGMVLPYYVGKWWYGTKKYTKDGVLMETAGRLFKAFEEDCDEKKAIEVLSAGGLEKFQKDEKNFEGQEHIIESAIKNKVPIGVMKTLEKMDGWKRKTYGLLWAYMTRTKFQDAKLDAEKLDVAQEAVSWNSSLLSIALAYSVTKPILSSMRVNQNLVQAIQPGGSPLLQLPHFTEELCEKIEEFGAKDHWTIQRFMSLPDEKRRQLCIGKDGLTEEQYKEAISVAQKIPILHVEKAFFKVQGDKVVTPNAICQLVLKVRVVPAGVKPPPVDPKDLEDEDPAEDDIDALIGRTPSKSKAQTGASEKSPIPTNEVEKSALVTGTETALPTLTHAPFFPAATLPKWHVFLADRRAGRMIIAPMTILQFPENTDNFQVQTFKLQFGAPPNGGEVHFQMHLVCDSYLGTDYKASIILKVDEPGMFGGRDEDEISEPDEDSIAGVMASARGQKVKPSAYHSHHHHDDDSDEDDESDTDGEQDDGSATDTDTDTDEE